MARVAVVGGGIVGVTAALLAARRGWQVTLLEAEPQLWSRASAINEGKVHLGPVFALGDRATLDVLQRGAARFGSVVEEAVDGPVPWESLTTDCFDYLVMPDSLLAPEQLGACYRAMNDRWVASGAPDYLGAPLPWIVDPVVRRDPWSGLPSFRTQERSVEPTALGRLLVKTLESDPRATIRVGCRVTGVRETGTGALVRWEESDEEGRERFDAVVNAAWDQRQALLPQTAQVAHNFRLKCAVRLPREGARTPTVTLVQGPYGDVVTHESYVYASWYPAARLTHEHAATPSPAAYHRLASLRDRNDLVEAQLAPLRKLGLVPEVAPEGAELVGGFIAGHGDLDIHERGSALHRRSEFGPARHGRMVVATNFKLTTAPLAARLAVDAAADLVDR